MFMNEFDIDNTIASLEKMGSPLAPYARYLGSWRDVINSNSDGWPFWKVGHQAASKLSVVLDDAMSFYRGRLSAEPSVDDARKALAPIRSAATRHGLPQPHAVGVD
jgi:hypothetical protein